MMHMLSIQTIFQTVAVTYNTDDPENGLEGLAQVNIAMLCSVYTSYTPLITGIMVIGKYYYKSL